MSDQFTPEFEPQSQNLGDAIHRALRHDYPKIIGKIMTVDFFDSLKLLISGLLYIPKLSFVLFRKLKKEGIEGLKKESRNQGEEFIEFSKKVPSNFTIATQKATSSVKNELSLISKDNKKTLFYVKLVSFSISILGRSIINEQSSVSTVSFWKVQKHHHILQYSYLWIAGLSFFLKTQYRVLETSKKYLSADSKDQEILNVLVESLEVLTKKDTEKLKENENWLTDYILSRDDIDLEYPNQDPAYKIVVNFLDDLLKKEGHKVETIPKKV